MELLYLSEEEMIQCGVLNMERCIESMADAFKLLGKGDYRLGGDKNCDHGLRIRFPKDSDVQDMPLDAPGRWFTVMPAYLGGKYHCVGIKSYGANQKNCEQGMPRSILMMQLLDVETGAPLAFMSANILSAMRTGAVSGLYARYFSNPESQKVAIIGPGVIGRYSLDAIMTERPNIKSISIFGRGKASREAFIKHCENKAYSVQIDDCSSEEMACKDADIIITANSQARFFSEYPKLKDESIKKDACVIVTSAVCIDRIYTEGDHFFVADDARMYSGKRNIDACPSSEEEKRYITVKGAISERLNNGKEVIDFPKFILKDKQLQHDNRICFCASGGIPIEDVAWAYECYQQALHLGIGNVLSVWDSSCL